MVEWVHLSELGVKYKSHSTPSTECVVGTVRIACFIIFFYFYAVLLLNHELTIVVCTMHMGTLLFEPVASQWNEATAFYVFVSC